MSPIVRRVAAAFLCIAVAVGVVIGGLELVLGLLDEQERAALSEGIVTVEDRRDGADTHPLTLYERIDVLSGSLSIKRASRTPYSTEAGLSEAAEAATGFLGELMAAYCDVSGRFTPEGMAWEEKMAFARINAYLLDISSDDARFSAWYVEYSWIQDPAAEPPPPEGHLRPALEEKTRLTYAQILLDGVNLQPYAAGYYFEGELPSVAYAEARAKEESKLAALHMDEYNEEYNLVMSKDHAQVFAGAIDKGNSLVPSPKTGEVENVHFPLWYSALPLMVGREPVSPQTFCQYDLGGGLYMACSDLSGRACVAELHLGELEGKMKRFAFADADDWRNDFEAEAY